MTTTFEVPNQIRNIRDIKDYINMCIFAENGVGKTILGAQLPKPLFFGCELGTLSAKQQGLDADIWPTIEFKEFLDAKRWLTVNCTKSGFPYEWLVVDTATALDQSIFRWILETEYLKSPEKRSDEDLPQIQDWNLRYMKMRRMVAELNALPINVLWLAHVLNVEINEKELLLPAIDSSPKKGYMEARSFAAAHHAIGYYEHAMLNVPDPKDKAKKVATPSRRLIFKGDGRVTAKDRFNAFGDRVVMTLGNSQRNNLGDMVSKINLDEVNRVNKMIDKENNG